MRIYVLSAAIAAGFLLTTLAAVPLGAQGDRAAGPESVPPVAVIDINRVFAEHLRFKQEMEFMKKDVEDFEAYLRQQQNRVKHMTEERANFKPTTPDYKRIDLEITQLTSDVNVQTQLKRKEFLQREARIYYNVYTELTNEVADFAMRNGVTLVLRYNSQKIDPEDRTSVLQGVNNSVVFHHDLDITSFIIERINRGQAVGDRRSGPALPSGSGNN